ncbi:MAG TPA: hypothetical protein VFS77_06170 [Pyrinomonadaceae bacterium]|nr:hypothetical protein [Pyrinomonadaceae bacterium]
MAINWHVYLLTDSAFALGLVGLFRGVPIMAAVIGAPLSVVTGGLGSIAAAAVAAWRSKSLMDFEV